MVFGTGKKLKCGPNCFWCHLCGAIPFFFMALGWLIRNIWNKKPIVLPVLATGFFFISAYLYLIIVGTNIPFWVYLIIAALVIYGAFSTY